MGVILTANIEKIAFLPLFPLNGNGEVRTISALEHVFFLQKVRGSRLPFIKFNNSSPVTTRDGYIKCCPHGPDIYKVTVKNLPSDFKIPTERTHFVRRGLKAAPAPNFVAVVYVRDDEQRTEVKQKNGYQLFTINTIQE